MVIHCGSLDGDLAGEGFGTPLDGQSTWKALEARDKSRWDGTRTEAKGKTVVEEEFLVPEILCTKRT